MNIVYFFILSLTLGFILPNIALRSAYAFIEYRDNATQQYFISQQEDQNFLPTEHDVYLQEQANLEPQQIIIDHHEAPYIVDQEREGDPLLSTTRTATYGILAQSKRENVISQNLANLNTVGSTPGADPYRRKIIFFENEYDSALQTDVVKFSKIEHDSSPFKQKYEPYHPAADENGYVKYPNVDLMLETVDLKEAQRSLQANVNSFSIGLANQKVIIGMMQR